MTIKYYARLECGRDERFGPNLGPFDDYLQLTYSELRAGPDGAIEIADHDKDGDWYVRPQFGDPQIPYSDVVIWAVDEA